ncbi:hypothetical protein D3C71_1922070 [compost metagenome]
MLVHFGIGGDLDAGCRLESRYGAAAGGETDDVAAASDLAGDGNRIVTGRIHEDEALFSNGFREFVDRLQWHGATFGHCAQRFFKNGG